MSQTDQPRSFTVTALWDAEAEVFTSVSDVPGLHIEAETFDAFVALVHDLAPDVIAHNLPSVSGPFSIAIHARRDLDLTAA
jgi:Domain of unknown function (DUF1902)